MEFLEKIWEKIKSLFSRKVETVDQAAVDEARARRLKDLNDPEDDFSNDVAYDEEELAQLSRKAANRRNFRTGYYIFGTILAVGLLVWGVVGIWITPRPDICIMIQADGMVQTADIESIRALVAQAAGDRNNDGKVVVEVTEIGMPAAHTEDNESAFVVAREDIEEALIAPNIGLIFGRDEFLATAGESDALADSALSLSQMGLELNENNPLHEYKVTYRVADTAQSALAQEVFHTFS